MAPYGITVNDLAPGTILTDINRDFFAVEENLKCYEKIIPMHRLGVPEDCGGAAVFFASNESSYITGTTLLVDGGYNAQL